MESIFTKLQENENGEFQKNESKWYNGHAYLPLFNYHLNYDYLNGKVKIHYEFRQSEFSKSSLIDGGTFSDRHICELECEIATDKKHSNFSISERGITAKLFKKEPCFFFKVKSNDEKLTLFLQKNKNLNSLFQIVENSPELSPMIKGEMIDEKKYKLNIIYNTQQKNEEALNLINEFCKNLIVYFKELK